MTTESPIEWGCASSVCTEFSRTEHVRHQCTYCGHCRAVAEYISRRDRSPDMEVMSPCTPSGAVIGGLPGLLISLGAVPNRVTATFSRYAEMNRILLGNGPDVYLLSAEILETIWIAMGRPDLGGAHEQSSESATMIVDNERQIRRTFDELQVMLHRDLIRKRKEARGTPPVKLVFHVVQNTKDAAGDTLSCAICLEDMLLGEMARKLPTCCHTFHMGCVDIWLMNSRTCPMCRRDILL